MVPGWWLLDQLAVECAPFEHHDHKKLDLAVMSFAAMQTDNLLGQCANLATALHTLPASKLASTASG